MKPSRGDRPVVLFDGVCNLCNGVVRFIIARDPAARFRFAPLQSAVAGEGTGAAGKVGVAAGATAGEPSGATTGAGDSIVLVEAGKRYTRSAAALRIARGLRFPWPLLYALMLVPRPVRDMVYDWVARHRYGWFGKRAACMAPTPEVRGRFLE
jgi:predicted DCC family thiol-disulfide oxidoreductase YuxK